MIKKNKTLKCYPSSLRTLEKKVFEYNCPNKVIVFDKEEKELNKMKGNEFEDLKDKSFCVNSFNIPFVFDKYPYHNP